MADDVFDPLRYIASYPDLILAYGLDAEAGRAHYERQGRAEGRNPFLFNPLIYGASNPDLLGVFGPDSLALTRHYIQFGYSEHRPSTGFDPLLYGASNPDLVQVFGANPTALLEHYVRWGVNEHRPVASFDPLEYAASNPDLARVFRLDTAALLNHWVRFGIFEHRHADTFDLPIYAASNPDLLRAFSSDLHQILVHYVQYGVDENRPLASFDPLIYAGSNPDLARVFHLDQAGLLNHWIRFGAFENRPSAGFDPRQYLAVNPDLIPVFGTDLRAATIHFVQFGADEHRPPGGFDPVAYLLSNPDLAAQGLTLAAALDHFLSIGAGQGRPGDILYGREQTSHAVTNGTVTGVLETGSDRDWYSVYLPFGTSVTFTVTTAGPPGFDGDLALFDEAFNPIAADLDSGPGSDAALSHFTTAGGLYYVAVSSGTGTAGPYVLQAGPPAATSQTTFTNEQLGPGVIVQGNAAVYDQVTVNVTPALQVLAFQGFQLLDVEKFTINSTKTGPISFDMSGSTGQEVIRIASARGAIAVNNLTGPATLELVQTPAASDISLKFQDSVLAGTSDRMVVVVSESQFDELTIGSVSSPSAGVETLVFALQAGATGINSMNALHADIVNLEIGGRAGLTIFGTLATTIRTIVSRQTEGNLQLDFSNNDAANQPVTFLGSNARAAAFRDVIVAGDSDNIITTFAGADVITTGAGNDTVSTGAGFDRIIIGGSLSANDDIDGGADGATLVVANRNHVDSDFAVVSNVTVLEIADFFTATLGASAQAAGIRTVIAASAAASTLDASAYTAGLIVDVSAGGNDQVTTGSGADRVIAGIGSQIIALNGGDDTLSVSGTEWGAGDQADADGGTDTFELDNRTAIVSALVDLTTTIGFERFTTAGSAFAAGLTLTGGTAAAPIVQQIVGTGPLTVTLAAGLTNANQGFDLFGSAFATTLIKDNVGTATPIDFTGGTGVDTLQVHASDLVGSLVMDGNGGTDLLLISGGTLADSGFGAISDVETLTNSASFSATLGATAAAAGINTVSLIDNGSSIIVGAAFGRALTVRLSLSSYTFSNIPQPTPPGNNVDASQLAMPITFFSDSVTLQANDVLIGGSTSGDVLELDYLIYQRGLSASPALPVHSLVGLSGVETINVHVLGNVSRVLNAGPVMLDTTPGDLNGVDSLRVNVTAAWLNSVNTFMDAPIDGSAATANLYVIGSSDVKTGSGNDRILTGFDAVSQPVFPHPAVGGTVLSGAGNDRIAGRAGNDTIDAGSGADKLLGGIGADTLTGGTEADSFIYIAFSQSTATARDTITDFISGTDTIDVRYMLDQAQLIGDTINFVGNAANLAAAQALLTPLDDTFDVVFQQDAKILWFDNGDGVLDASDLRILLTDVVSLIGADVMHGATVMPATGYMDTFFM
jgi:hypothetical protein